MTEQLTKADPILKTDQELLALIQERLSLDTSKTGVRDLGTVEGAIGALFVGQHFGLKILRIIHSSKTLRQYEQFLGSSFEELIPQHGQYIDRSFAWKVVITTRQYWDLVARKIKLEGTDRRAIVDAVPDVR